MMEKTDMLKQIAEYYGLTKNMDFARFFEISDQNAYIKRKTGVLDFEEIYKRCPDISPDWLLSRGEGPMLRADRIENSGNISIGNNTRQILRTTHETETMKKALDAVTKGQEALEREQNALKTAQEQISGLIAILSQK